MIYKEGPYSTVVHDDREYLVDDLLTYADAIPVTTLPMKAFDWMEGVVDSTRVQDADLSYPILVYPVEDTSQWVILDGWHRLNKARQYRRATIEVKRFTPKDLDVLPSRTPCFGYLLLDRRHTHLGFMDSVVFSVDPKLPNPHNRILHRFNLRFVDAHARVEITTDERVIDLEIESFIALYEVWKRLAFVEREVYTQSCVTYRLMTNETVQCQSKG